ncbi:MAG: 6-phosphogluconolactonase [Syntrophorhabdales bacterium]|jgi:6-phosphogluconolactonase
MADDIAGGPGREVRVFETLSGLASHMAERFRLISEEAVARAGRFAVALSGGRTPVDLYVELARRGSAFDWAHIHIFLVDERFVPYSDRESNFGMIKRTLLDAVLPPPENVHPIDTAVADPAISAQKYEEEIVAFFGAGGAMPRFDLVMLGLGEDGHTASLFPGSPALREKTHPVQAIAPHGKVTTPRVTITLPVINGARNVVFLITGKGKARVLRRVIEEKDPQLPASLVEPKEGRLSFLCDREAASTIGTPASGYPVAPSTGGASGASPS